MNEKSDARTAGSGMSLVKLTGTELSMRGWENELIWANAGDIHQWYSLMSRSVVIKPNGCQEPMATSGAESFRPRNQSSRACEMGEFQHANRYNERSDGLLQQPVAPSQPTLEGAQAMRNHVTISKLTKQDLTTLLDRFIAKTRHAESGCIEWTGTGNGNGYGHLRLPGKVERSSTKHKAHRISYMLFIGDIPEGLHVMHSCDNRRCVKPEHLSVGTCSDNMQDCVRKGRHTNKKKMSKIEEIEAEQLATSGMTYKEIAALFELPAPIIGNAVRRVRAANKSKIF